MEDIPTGRRSVGVFVLGEEFRRDRCGELNRNLPPKRNRKDEMPLRQTWSRSQVQAMLRNPKYTGYNVWGRHDKPSGRPFRSERGGTRSV